MYQSGMVVSKKSSSRAASPLAQAEERISNRVLKNPIGPSGEPEPVRWLRRRRGC